MLISVTSAIALKYKNFHENILSYSNKAQMYTPPNLYTPGKAPR